MKRTILAGLILVSLTACSSTESRRADSPVERPARERETVAHKVGESAYGAAQGTGKAIKEAGKHIGRAAKEFGSGWKEARREGRQSRQE